MKFRSFSYNKNATLDMRMDQMNNYLIVNLLLITIFDLVHIIKKIKKNDKKHPAKNIFQSLRIEVNQEIENLKELLSKVLFFLTRLIN